MVEPHGVDFERALRFPVKIGKKTMKSHPNGDVKMFRSKILIILFIDGVL